MKRPIMDEEERRRLRQAAKQRRLLKFGARNLSCSCGETDPLAFIAEHPFRRDLDGMVWAMCLNCHAKKSQREHAEHPTIGCDPVNPFFKMGHRVLGVIIYLELCTESLRIVADFLFRLGGK